MIKLDSEQFLQTRNKIKEHIIPTLNDITESLIKMINDEKIISFSFLKNNHYFANEKPIYISVTLNTLTNFELRLGLFDTAKEIENNFKVKLPANCKKELNNINENLIFLNNYFIKDNPEIKEQSYYSLKAVNRLDGFANEKNMVFIPEFKLNEDIDVLKQKKIKIKNK